jgi:hypothetical protein
MSFRLLLLAFAVLFSIQSRAAGLGDPEMDVARRLVEVATKQEATTADPRVAKVRDQIAKVMKATGENDQAVAQSCMRNARYLFDVAKLQVSPLEVLEALAAHAPAGKPLNETTERYFDLRARQKLDHAGAMAGLAGKK